MTIVTLQLLSSQFTPRAVDTFLKDRFNQITLGCFAGVFAYCVMVLRSIRAADEPEGGFVPGVSVNLGILLGLGSVQLLVVFIFRVGRSIDVGDIATRLGTDTEREIVRRYAEASTAPAAAGETLVAAWRQSGPGQVVRATRSGYVQAVRKQGLIGVLADHSGRARVAVCAGTSSPLGPCSPSCGPTNRRSVAPARSPSSYVAAASPSSWTPR